MQIIIFDFEVFKYDVLLGLYILDESDLSKKQLYQTWDKENIKKLYYLYQDAIWVGHNNKGYDNHILEAIIKDKDPYNVSQNIIAKNSRPSYTNIKLYTWDLNEEVMVKLKLTEAFWGKKIHMTEVDFNIDRPLTEQEKIEEEKYNKSDLDQTYENFLGLQHSFTLKRALLNEFNLPIDVLSKKVATISAQILGVTSDPSKITPIVPYRFPQLQVANQDVLNWYHKQDYKNSQLTINLCGVEHTLGVGGIHGARKKYYGQTTLKSTLWYFDVSGYYNLLMIKYNLFTRSMNENSKQKYTNLYYEQLKLKGVDDLKRNVFKVALLTVFGASNNKYTPFYDPYHFEMVTLNGQLFLIDLLEKLAPYINLVQSNTDGIILETLNVNESKMLSIINEWQQRTGFVLKSEKLKQIHQRDVNNYIVEFANGKTSAKGEALKHTESYNAPFQIGGAFNSKEPIVISLMLRDALLNGTPPEESINRWINELRLFQFICKKDSFNKLILVKSNGEQEIPQIVRAFPWKNGEPATIYKEKLGKRMKVTNLPQSVFIYNEDIRDESVIKELLPKINLEWYVERAYEKLKEFVE